MLYACEDFKFLTCIVYMHLTSQNVTLPNRMQNRRKYKKIVSDPNPNVHFESFIDKVCTITIFFIYQMK